ncbi:RNA polymerase sigma factor [Pseudoalteromonas rhizosphaerae]|uniref:RNA polymerase sigma factor n=1 Tax=Pseudoalteromonas rhizosphaerae TaxID=2518973 RepID=A0ABW8KSM3_9GAMM
MSKREFSITTELLKDEQKLKAAIRKWVKVPEDEADVFQETFATVIEQDKHKKIDNPLAYAVTVARHFAWKLSAKKSEPYDETLDTRESECIEQRYSQHQQISTIQTVLKNMPPMRQQVFIRRRLYNQSREHIAKELGLSEDAVKKHINRALAQLAMHAQ